jgi:MFS family permease
VLYALAYVGTILLFLAPLLVSLTLKNNTLVGTDRAPNSLSLVVGAGAFLAIFANPLLGKLSDRTTSPLGMRRPWMIIGLLGGSVGVLVVALAPSIPVVLVGWCIAQVFFNALLAALIAVLPDQVPVAQRGRVAGVLGVCLPIASVSGTYVVQLFTGNTIAMFLAPCAIGGVLILLFAVALKDRRLAAADKPAWSLREFTSTFYLNPWKHPDFAWAFSSRFLLVLAYAFLTTYQVYYLLQKVGSAADDVPRQLFLATLAMSSVVVVASLVGGWLSDRTRRRKVFVGAASVVFGLALFVIAFASTFNGFVVGMAIGGLFRSVHGCRSRTCRRCASRPEHRRQGSRGDEHCRRVALLRRPRDRARDPGHQPRQLRRPVRGGRGRRCAGSRRHRACQTCPVRPRRLLNNRRGFVLGRAERRQGRRAAC